MKKFLFAVLFLAVMFYPKFSFAGCTPSFPSLWPPSIVSTQATSSTVGLTWSQDLPFIGDITAYNIYLNGSLFKTLSPSVANVLFSPAGEGSYSINNLKPNTSYNVQVGVSFAIPVGCGITWTPQLKSGTTIETKANNTESTAETTNPNAPLINIDHIGSSSVTISIAAPNPVYGTSDTVLNEYPLSSVDVHIVNACLQSSYNVFNVSGTLGYYNQMYNTNVENINPECYKEVPYIVGTGKNRVTEYRYILTHSFFNINNSYNFSGSAIEETIDYPYVGADYMIYATESNSNGDVSPYSDPVYFMVLPAPTK